MKRGLVFMLVVCVPTAAYAAGGVEAAIPVTLMLQMLTTGINAYFASEIPKMKRELHHHGKRLSNIERGIVE